MGMVQIRHPSGVRLNFRLVEVAAAAAAAAAEDSADAVLFEGPAAIRSCSGFLPGLWQHKKLRADAAAAAAAVEVPVAADHKETEASDAAVASAADDLLARTETVAAGNDQTYLLSFQDKLHTPESEEWDHCSQAGELFLRDGAAAVAAVDAAAADAAVDAAVDSGTGDAPVAAAYT
jgi:hypothetical protein